jgi:hypothetical protein
MPMLYADLIFFVLFIISIFISKNKSSAALNFLLLCACLILGVVGKQMGYIFYIIITIILVGGVFTGSLWSRTTYFLSMIVCLCMAYLYHATSIFGKDSLQGELFYIGRAVYPYIMCLFNVLILWSVDKTGNDYVSRPFTNGNHSNNRLDSLLNRTNATIRLARSFLNKRGFR